MDLNLKYYLWFFRPPPLDYPSPEDTDDTDTYNDYKSKDGRYLRDSGSKK